MRNAKSRAHNSDCFSLIFEEIYLKHLQIYGLLNLSCPWRTSHCSTNASSFTINSSMPLSKTRHGVSNARGRPGVRECLVPGRDKIGPNARTDINVARGGEGTCWFKTTWLVAASLVEIGIFFCGWPLVHLKKLLYTVYRTRNLASIKKFSVSSVHRRMHNHN